MSYLDKFQKIIIAILTILMGLVVMLATLELIYVIAFDILSPPLVLLDADELLDIFGYFLLILIGIELLETFSIYLHERAINVQVVLLVAMIALARKVIILDAEEIPVFKPHCYWIYNPCSCCWILFGETKSRRIKLQAIMIS